MLLRHVRPCSSAAAFRWRTVRSGGRRQHHTSAMQCAFDRRKGRYTQHDEEHEPKPTIPIGAYVTLAIPAAAVCLGVWQVRRRRWKLDLIEQLKRKTELPPVPLPQELAAIDAAEWDYRRVYATGHFDHSRQLLVRPRTRTDKQHGATGSLLSAGITVGAHVITPFVIDGTGDEILVNRGWVPAAGLSKATRAQFGQTEGTVTITGVYRASEKRPQFAGRNKPERDHYTYRDVEAMAQSRNTLPVYVEADRDSTVEGGPVGGQTVVSLRNEHLQYIVTWWSLALITSYMWCVRYLKPR